jgi:CDP-diacylglycerol--serine O-phosphatidyltransferase
VGFIWVSDDFQIAREETVRWLAAILTAYAGITMVANVPFYSFKDFNLRRNVPFWAILLVVLALVMISAKPPLVLFGLFLGYGVSGYALWVWKRRRRLPR